MAVTSTVPAAINALLGYMNTVAANNPSLNIGVFLGEPIVSVPDNFLAVGDFSTWLPVDPNTYEWAAIPGTAKRRTESYSLNGVIRAYSGGATDQDKLDRLNDAFTMLDGLHQAILDDYFASGALSGPGAWGALHASMEAYGPLDNQGFGLVFGLKLQVIDAELVG